MRGRNVKGVRVKQGTPDHPKTKKLARLLKVERYQAVGILECLWHWTARYAPDGLLSRFEAADWCEGIDWHGEPEALRDALVATGFLDDQEGKLTVHDWRDHAEDYVHAKLARRRGFFADGFQPRISKLSQDERPIASEWYKSHTTDGKRSE